MRAYTLGKVGRKLMQTGYFNAAWHDIKNSPGWFGKLLVLTLVSIIPIFGWIVVAGYLYGWARDLAWGVHAPLPAHVFGNEDGKLYSRGFFVVVIGLVCSLIPWLVEVVGSMVTGGYLGSGWSYHAGFLSFPLGIASGIAELAFFVLSLAASLFAVFFSWVGAMRASIYGRLSAGFQIGKIWNMVRHDFGGILRILGMFLLLFAVIAVVTTVLVLLAVFLCLVIGFFATGGNMNINASRPDAAIMGMVFAVGGVAVLLSVVAGFASMAVSLFVMMMVARALGYWTKQFDVPAWRGQDDPMPFELAGGSAGFGQQPPLGR